jgi:hypothetical protein
MGFALVSTASKMNAGAVLATLKDVINKTSPKKEPVLVSTLSNLPEVRSKLENMSDAVGAGMTSGKFRIMNLLEEAETRGWVMLNNKARADRTTVILVGMILF